MEFNCYVADALAEHRGDGLGFVLHRPPDTPADEPGLVALTLDRCRDPRTGRIADWARDVVQAVGSYTELSPDGTGLHVWLLGVLPGFGRRKGDYENAQSGRFLPITGRHLPGTPGNVEPRQEALLRVHGWFFTAAPPGGRAMGSVARKTREHNEPAPPGDDPMPLAASGEAWGNGDDVPLPVGVIDARLRRCVGPWPRRVAGRLFAPGADGRPLWLDGPDALFAWVGRCLAERGLPAPQWQTAVGHLTPAGYFRHLQQFAEPCAAVESAPHQPPLPGHCYLHPTPTPTPDGSALKDLIRRFSPASALDGRLLRAFLLTLVWGGPAPGRPAFLFTSADDQEGAAAARVPRLAAELVGGLACGRVVLADGRGAELVRAVTTEALAGGRPNTLVHCLAGRGEPLPRGLAECCVCIQLARPRREASWERTTRAVIERRRWEVVGDLVAVLAGPRLWGAGRATRWAAWEDEVLARGPEAAKCLALIEQRRRDGGVVPVAPPRKPRRAT